MPDYSNLQNAKDETISNQRKAIHWMGGIIVLLIVAVIMLPRSITLHYPPDLSLGADQKIGEIPETSVYSFAYNVFQQLNRWPNNGATDYEDKLYMLKSYLTPACYQERQDDFKRKKNSNQLRDRERAVWEIPGRGYNDKRVKKESNSSWVVYLDLHISETMLGESIKDRMVNYPLRIVRYNADPVLNPYQLAFDCFAEIPRAIKVQTEADAAAVANR